MATLPRETARKGLEALLSAGADKAQCRLTISDKHEMNVESGEINLLRTTFDTRFSFTAIKDRRKGQTAINKTDSQAIQGAMADVMAIASAAAPDDANDIAERQPPATFSSGPDSPDLARMHQRLKELLRQVKAKYPKAILRQAYLDFTRTRSWIQNSEGVDFETSQGVYRFTAMFSSKDGEKVSSFNYTGFSLRDLDRELLRCGSLDELLRQSEEQTTTHPITGKFVGDIIFTPECVGDMLEFLVWSIMDGAIISGSSVYKDSLGKQVASPLLTVHSKPVSGEICDGYFVTSDGYAAQNSTILDHGVLKTFLLSLYGAKKTGKDRAVNDGGAFVIEPGETPLADMVKSVKRGLLMARFSGGHPSRSGDFSGVAKNSYLIEDGAIKYPVSECMVSGSFAEMLKGITAVSKERVDFGFGIVPWIAASGATVSGK